ncbi:MAG: hypothetical protein MZU84_07390 [Sphingobacterium sp.]|nr:hypothetical protein [Sphingobacterium sp.]
MSGGTHRNHRGQRATPMRSIRTAVICRPAGFVVSRSALNGGMGGVLDAESTVSITGGTFVGLGQSEKVATLGRFESVDGKWSLSISSGTYQVKNASGRGPVRVHRRDELFADLDDFRAPPIRTDLRVGPRFDHPQNPGRNPSASTIQIEKARAEYVIATTANNIFRHGAFLVLERTSRHVSRSSRNPTAIGVSGQRFDRREMKGLIRSGSSL